MSFDDNYFTSVDTDSYFTRNGEGIKSDYLSGVELGESFTPGETALSGVQKAINHGLPSVMISAWEPRRGQRGKGHGTAVDKISELQQNAVGELIKVNETNFTMHGPIVDLMGVGKTAQGGMGVSAKKRNENFNLLKHNMEQADNIAKKADLEKTPFCIHVSNGVGSIGDKFDSGYETKNGETVYGRKNYMIDKDTGQLAPINSDFQYMNVNEQNKEVYEMVPGTETSTGKALFEITPEKHVKMANKTALHEENQKIIDAKIKMKKLKDTDVPEKSELMQDLQRTINTARSKIAHLESPEYGTSEAKERYVNIEDYSNKIVPEQIAELAMHSLENTETHPVVAVENEPEWQLGSNPELLMNWVEKGRERFTNKLVEEGYERSEAERKANELIGVTLDTGHLNTLKNQINPDTNEPWTEEELKEEVERMAATGTKLVHIADNIGKLGQDTHLIIGRGDAKNEEYMKILKEHGFGGQAQFEAFTKEHGKLDKFGTKANLMGIGAPMYSTRSAPSFRQVGQSKTMYRLRSGGYGHQLPPRHFKRWGGPFSGLPSTFGAKQGQSKDKFSGAPTE